MAASSSALSSELPPFPYKPFTVANEIRLLRIPRKRPHTAQDEDTNYTLIHASLDDSLYTALSYCWEGGILTERMTLNSQPILVTRSLATALASLQNEESDLTLWADAICINQQDLGERTALVQLMGQIYKAAQRVIAWLGPSTTETDLTTRESRILGSKLLESGMWNISDNELLAKIPLSHYSSESALSVEKLFGIVDDLIQKEKESGYPFC